MGVNGWSLVADAEVVDEPPDIVDDLLTSMSRSEALTDVAKVVVCEVYEWGVWAASNSLLHVKAGVDASDSVDSSAANVYESVDSIE